ncbi:hypothetical protein FA13DRAFT_1707615 [Coprinellus micaceus]|uniref:Uncharacterized protein n=1 Tax=Coprinellus micaceus TaxID=71717 RepID=A0A4Y7TMK4_COPMI|nr:hypothetical protein FA13DRAFT_1707615 [Coprinellus micaceus]
MTWMAWSSREVKTKHVGGNASHGRKSCASPYRSRLRALAPRVNGAQGAAWEYQRATALNEDLTVPSDAGNLSPMSFATSRAPIHRLPVEILSKVFRAHVDSNSRDTVGFVDDLEDYNPPVNPVPLTHVCRAWRVSAAGNSSLWTDIWITVASSSELFKLFLARSSPLPLDLTINITPRSLNSEFKLENIVNMLQQALDAPPANQAHPTTRNRIRSLEITTGTMAVATLIASIFEAHSLPSLVRLHLRPIETELMPMNNPNFKPPIRRSLVRLALFNCCRGIKADALRSILVSCVHLETLVLGGLQLEGAPTQPQLPPPNTAAAPTFRIPSLRTLVVASPVFHPADASTDLVKNCRDGCCCVFRDFTADNLEYLEIAGFVNEALTHLGSLITQRVSRPNTSPLTLRINVGDRLNVASDELERRLLSIPPNIHLHLYDRNFCSQDEISEAFDEWVEKAHTVTFYLPDSEDVREELEWSGDHPLTSYPRLDPIRGLIPVIIHPVSGNPFLPEEGGTTEIPKWFHNPDFFAV